MVRPTQDRFIWYAAPSLVALIALLVFGAASYISANRWVDHALEVRQELDEWLLARLDAETGVRGYFISEQPAFLEPYLAAIPRERQKAARLTSLVADNPTQVENMKTADRDALAAMDVSRRIVEMLNAGDRDRARALIGEGKERTDRFREDVKRVRAEEDALLVRRRSQAGPRAGLVLFSGLLLVIASVGSMTHGWRLQRGLAREARRRLGELADVAQALASARIASEVAEVITEYGTRAAGADTCTLYLLVDGQTTLKLIGERGVAPEIVDKLRCITETSGNPETFATLRSRTAIWAENEADYLAHFPALAKAKAQGPRAKAFWSVPLIAEDNPIGLLGMGFYAPQSFSKEYRSFVDAFTKQCAQALMRALRLEREEEARRWFTTTLRSIGDAVVATDEHGRITFMNHVAENLTGWTENEARSRPLDEVFRIFADETKAVAESPVTAALREGTIVGLAHHTVLRTKRGDEIAIDDSAAPIRDEKGQLLGVVLVFRDVTHDRALRIRSTFLAEAGEALVSSLDFRTTLATVARLAVPRIADWCAIDILEPGAKAPQQVAVAHVDPAKVEFAREFGEKYPPDPNAPTGAPQVIRTGRSELYTELPSVLIEAGARDAEHLRIIRALRLESAMIVPLRGRDRTLGAMTFIYADSGRRYAESDLAFAEEFARRAAMAIENAYAHRAAEDALRAREHVLAVVSHDLRNPLNILSLAATRIEQLAGASESSGPIKKNLGTIVGAVDRMHRLVGDLLDLATIEAGQSLGVELEKCDGIALARQAADALEPLAKARGLTLKASLSDGPTYVDCDSERVQQVFANLIGNAIKFTREGGSIEVGAHLSNGELVLSVKDTGTGIRDDQVAHIFEPYWQVGARRKEGVGLGLSIVKAIVDAHGGRIWVETAMGKGSSFFFTLPVPTTLRTVEIEG